ncbi:hypothetical protein IQ07DRAFT_105344 [Pyrenochaeta sp. DS3sAY3a]|nr:hypothetical protein IQ07DRAFT_105344 [Pyrenochaeta sp. DS3sAY3a]
MGAMEGGSRWHGGGLVRWKGREGRKEVTDWGTEESLTREMEARARVISLAFDLGLIDLMDCPAPLARTCQGLKMSEGTPSRTAAREASTTVDVLTVRSKTSSISSARLDAAGPTRHRIGCRPAFSPEKLDTRNEVRVEDASPPGKVPPVHTFAYGSRAIDTPSNMVITFCLRSTDMGTWLRFAGSYRYNTCRAADGHSSSASASTICNSAEMKYTSMYLRRW